MTDKQCSSCGGFCGRGGCKRENVKREWVGLTDEEIDKFSPTDIVKHRVLFARLIEAILKDRNT